jgi:predicted nicotinamide N-methyase
LVFAERPTKLAAPPPSQADMTGYRLKNVTVRIGGRDFALSILADHQQFAADDGAAEAAGISSATWPIFGQLWQAGTVLAAQVAQLEVGTRRVLEIGCGMALSSLVLQARGADVTASDHHPLAPMFLERNCALNGLPPIRYVHAHWDRPDPALGAFDIIVGGDVLYERGHADSIAGFVARHAAADAEVLISDAGRGSAGRLRRLLGEAGFTCEEQRFARDDTDLPPFRGRLMHFRRGI